MDELHSHYERSLPHRLPPGHTIFVTYRLAGTLPWHVRQLLVEEELLAIGSIADSSTATIRRRKGNFVRYDTWLDHDTTHAQWLVRPTVAAAVRESLFYFDKRAYHLHAFCIMPNHVHLLVTIEELGKPFYRILQSQKRYSATQANRLLQRTGPFWQAESYDHVVRNNREFNLILAYILNNPVKAGLVTEWLQWPQTYLADM